MLDAVSELVCSPVANVDGMLCDVMITAVSVTNQLPGLVV